MKVHLVNNWRSSWNPCVEHYFFEIPDEKVDVLMRLAKKTTAEIIRNNGEIMVVYETCDIGLACENVVGDFLDMKEWLVKNGVFVEYRAEDNDP